LFGNDGLYSESKSSLKTLFQMWASESRGEYLCLAGAAIGYATNRITVVIEILEGKRKKDKRTVCVRRCARMKQR